MVGKPLTDDEGPGLVGDLRDVGRGQAVQVLLVPLIESKGKGGT
jgi:hypothetical protein